MRLAGGVPRAVAIVFALRELVPGSVSCVFCPGVESKSAGQDEVRGQVGQTDFCSRIK